MNVIESFVFESRNAPISILLRLCLLCGLVISQNACATTPGMKTVEWREEVRLKSGRIIIVERAQEYRWVGEPGAGSGWLFERGRIRATLDDQSGIAVAWEGKLRPLGIDITEEGDIYLVAVTASAPGRREYGVPDGSYHVAFKYKSPGSWERISIDSVPSDFRPNQFISTYRFFIQEQNRSGQFISLADKDRLDSNPNINPAYRGWKRN